MKISILSDADSWKNDFVPGLAKQLQRIGHNVWTVHRASQIPRGDVLFLLGFTHLVPTLLLARNRHNIVLHESGLPKGKGWSPLSWQILEGKNRIMVTLFEAVEKVDAGPVYLRGIITLQGHELLDEIRGETTRTMRQMILYFIKHFDVLINKGTPQRGRSTYYLRRTPDDCQLNINKPLRDQFNLLRIADVNRYPAFFVLRGHIYEIRITKRLENEK